MDNNYFIDKETFEVYDNLPRYFICDKKIAYAVAELNKNGYRTKASCIGHYSIPEYYLSTEIDIKYLSEFQNKKEHIIKEIREHDFDVISEYLYTDIYIMFDDKYDFDELPEGFSLEEGTSNVTIRYRINHYKNDGIHKTQKEIWEEQEKFLNILNKWAIKLPENKERGI